MSTTLLSRGFTAALPSVTFLSHAVWSSFSVKSPTFSSLAFSANGDGDGEEDVKTAMSDHKNDANVRKEKKKKKPAKRHACTEPG
jgi:hypothetical protein